jgi:hypothetical protein
VEGGGEGIDGQVRGVWGVVGRAPLESTAAAIVAVAAVAAIAAVAPGPRDEEPGPSLDAAAGGFSEPPMGTCGNSLRGFYNSGI